ncbi:hypothetical protein BO70DRAFT_200347 [Aspergillus heteromorphus CBS 117.55]|uniref:Uncharacterized protein n=1 Tax=Aspergillus heteromorphus CBS 117.55 TaxID=1448321 RepID=A0A317WMU3_9EURO|nr:uncharacterized protein BO70DRAFT_200347 [Aspergillus heteromorphus CBS 117.55]PWY87699.1 hypothetical protein BO70DRAFT_200347 [Aspergillus heteromorphus CBS 117.55]
MGQGARSRSGSRTSIRGYKPMPGSTSCTAVRTIPPPWQASTTRPCHKAVCMRHPSPQGVSRLGQPRQDGKIPIIYRGLLLHIPLVHGSYKSRNKHPGPSREARKSTSPPCIIEKKKRKKLSLLLVSAVLKAYWLRVCCPFSVIRFALAFALVLCGACGLAPHAVGILS